MLWCISKEERLLGRVWSGHGHRKNCASEAQRQQSRRTSPSTSRTLQFPSSGKVHLSLSSSPICFSLFALKHISQCSRGMSKIQLSLSLPPLPFCFDCSCRDSNFSSTAASPGPSAGLPLPDRPLWLVALSSLFVPMLFLLSLLDLQAQMPASLERFTRSSVPSSTVCNTFSYAFYPESWHWHWRWQAALLSMRKIFSTTITN